MTTQIIAAAVTLLAIAMGLALAYYLLAIHRLNRAIDQAEKGEADGIALPSYRLPVLDQVSARYSALLQTMGNIMHMEEYQQRMLSYEKKEADHLQEKEVLNRQLTMQLSETRDANRTVSELNRELENKNRSLNEAINRLSALNQISKMLGLEHDRHEIYRMVSSLSYELLQAEICHLLLVDEDQGSLVLEFSQGLGEKAENHRTLRLGEGLAGWVAANRRPLLVADFSRQSSFASFSSMGYERRTAISVPIMTREKVIGVLSLINKKNNEAFTEDERTLLATIASEAAMALNNALLLERIQKSYFAIIQSLVTAVEAKDIYTRGHSERVTQYSLLIAEQMGFSMGQLEILQQAGTLHDIGKLTVELSILNKPSSLEKTEFDKIKLHPTVGYRILEPIDFEEKVKICVLQHHERIDGKGYPEGKSREEILLEARILSVADAFDAMTTRRPYREPLSIAHAIQEMDKCSGTQFDTEVVSVFKKVVHTMTSTGAIRTMIV